LARIVCIGHAVQDYVFSMPALPAGGRKFKAAALASRGGGPAATAAVAVAKLGGAAVLVARIGKDAVGAEIGRELRSFGVDCALVREFEAARSSLSAVMLDPQGERMIVNYSDPALPDHADWLPEDVAAAADAVLADSKWPNGAIFALEAARRAGVPAILDADEPMPDDPALLAAASHVAFSAEALAGLMATRDLAKALQEFRTRSGAWCCVTDGARGVLFSAGASVKRLDAHAVKPVDTLGAGDVWHGAFALALGEGRSEIDAIRFASAAAAVKVTRRGAREGAPTRAETEDFMRKNLLPAPETAC
jgi:sulfofructose kinase